MTLVLEWRASPRRLALQWIGGEGETAIVAQPDNPPQLAAVIGPPGQKGDKGEPGDSASRTLFVHSQDVAAATWTVVHGLGCFPNVSVENSAGDPVFADARHLDPNTVLITFSAAMGGRAFLS